MISRGYPDRMGLTGLADVALSRKDSNSLETKLKTFARRPEDDWCAMLNLVRTNLNVRPARSQ